MRNFTLDIAAILMLTVMSVAIQTRKLSIGKIRTVYLTSMHTCMAAAAVDIAVVVTDCLCAEFTVLRFLLHTIYMLLYNAQTLFLVVFIVASFNLWHIFYGNKLRFTLVALPYAFVVVALLSNPFTGWVFTIENGVYTHGPLYFTQYCCAMLYIIFSCFILVKIRNIVEKFRAIAIIAVVGVISASMVIHVMLPLYRVDSFGVAICLLITHVVILRPEDIVDTTTGFLKHTAYARNAKNAFKTGNRWSVVMLNIANYNSLFTLLGYEQIDELIKIIANKISKLNSDLGYSGEVSYLDRGRFRIVFPRKKRTVAEAFANLINSVLKKKIRCNGYDISLMPSVVLARCPEEIESFRSLMAFGVDFHEKVNYTGKVIMAPDIYQTKAFGIQNNIDTIIENAIENDSFEVYYQPIYSVTEKKFVSAEALLRLFDKEYGFISPEILITAAEKSGAIHKIGEIIFEKVCSFISSSEFLSLGVDYIEVNLSVAQCMHSDLADKILTIMGKYGVSADRLNLEITETAASFDQRVMTENLNALSRAGLEFSLDDFGTGYSNMKRVISLPLKIIKLDKSFVDEQGNPKMSIFLKNTVKMLKDMNMEIVVEGVETQEMLNVFTDLKCDFIQGYYFSKAIPQDKFIQFINNYQKAEA